MKRNEQLRSIPVVLVGAIHDEHRYRRPPGEIYGADAYVERQQLPDALADVLARFGLAPAGAPMPAREPAAPQPVASPPPAREPPTRVATPPASPAVPASPRVARPAAPAAAAPEQDEERAKAERLARIIVSDVILYNQEKFDAALREGDVVEALSAELEEGYALFSQRVDPKLCDPREFLQRELRRVAEARRSR
jgi:hypothetical protein